MARNVVVTDGDQRAALATVRSLGKAGYSVHVCASRSRSIAGSSRYCTSQTTVADPLQSPERFASDLVVLVQNKKADVLLPVSEASLLAVLPRREHFSCVIPFPSADSFYRICDKREVLERAVSHGIAVPMQIVITGGGTQTNLEHAVGFPLALKPSRSVSGPEEARARAGVIYASDSTELYAALN